jgi:hypothetical protein
MEQGRKNLSRTNALAYLAGASMSKKMSLIFWLPGRRLFADCAVFFLEMTFKNNIEES